MAKTCAIAGCTYPVFSKKLCRQHWGKEYGKRPRLVAPKRAKQLQEYSTIRESFLKRHVCCEMQLAGCTYEATEIHHAAGRENARLLDESKFVAACRNCHDKVTEDSAEAIEKGHSISKHKKAK